MYMVTFSVLLFAPYFLVRYTAWPLPFAGACCRPASSRWRSLAVAAPWSRGSRPRASPRWAR